MIIIDFFHLFSKQTYARNPRFSPVNQSHNANQLTTKKHELSAVDARLASLLQDLRFDEHGPGDNGAGVSIPNEMQEEMQRKFKINQFNLMASDMVSINR